MEKLGRSFMLRELNKVSMSVGYESLNVREMNLLINMIGIPGLSFYDSVKHYYENHEDFKKQIAK